MADLRGQRVVWAVPLVLVVAVVVAALTLGGGADDTSDGDDAGASSTSPSATPTPTGKVDPDTWCVAFREFADAQALFVATPDDPAAEDALETTAEALLDLGPPLGLGAGGLTSLQLLVDGSLDPATAPTATPGAAPEDSAALTTYLETACPA